MGGALAANVADIDPPTESFKLISPDNLIVLYDYRFRVKLIYGFVGGETCSYLSLSPCTGEPLFDLMVTCPRRGATVCSGQLLCLACRAILLFPGMARLYSPTLIGVVKILPPTKTPPVRASDNMAMRLMAYESTVHARKIN